ncbi:hypothetical protein [Streptomyces sp. NPDC017964]|uniref:hypothetical protein n=1 Tax=Streptomyces sp. NPDC017964 TaxID=3365022 RepID=UPI00379BB789
MPIHPGMVEDLAAGTRDLGIISWQLVDELGRAEVAAILAETGAVAPDPVGAFPLG